MTIDTGVIAGPKKGVGAGSGISLADVEILISEVGISTEDGISTEERCLSANDGTSFTSLGSLPEATTRSMSGLLGVPRQKRTPENQISVQEGKTE